MKLIELCNISRSGRNQEPLLHDVSLAVAAGQRLAVTGASGSGKTVLLRTMAMLDPFSAGKLQWCGQQVTDGSVPEYRSRVMYLHQQPAILEGTVEENLRHPFTFRTHRRRSFSRGAATQLFDRLDRRDAFLQQHSSSLSGGEKQILALVRGILLQPQVLLLDEATSALDENSVLAAELLIEDWLNGALAADGDLPRAAVWVSHNAAQQARVSNRVIQMAGGKLA